MPFASALSTLSETSRALDDVCNQVQNQGLTNPDLAFVFFSTHHVPAVESLATTFQERFHSRCLLGCIGESIVGNEQEIENQPALCLWSAQWNRPVFINPFHMELERTSEGFSLIGWPDALVDAKPSQSALFLLGDPFTFPIDQFLQEINVDHKGLPVMGGMASGIGEPGQCRFLLGDRVLEHGAVGVLLQGEVPVRSIVSQGCRPIGRPMVVTRAQDNFIVELGGKPPLVQLQDLWKALSPREKELWQQGLHIGRVINEYQEEFHRGDFLVRNVQGIDQKTGVLVITDRIRVGQTVQFQVRDAETADEDFHALMQMDLAAHEGKPAGALLFTCNGRGSRLFGKPHHDAGVIQKEIPNIPVAGFFAQGELGPIGRQNFIHGFTASVVLFED
ncbi:MAG TPA: FIST N-terminal domain-containing protein [Gemmataceae bacterium]|jgi:small ligand-binding sensory domain FIST|nr:FIST N-terminal domain-containing protein [Gemmataceae bacterium]